MEKIDCGHAVTVFIPRDNNSYYFDEEGSLCVIGKYKCLCREIGSVCSASVFPGIKCKCSGDIPFYKYYPIYRMS
jgi:hypothetical protein